MSTSWVTYLRNVLWFGSLFALVGLITTAARGQDEESDIVEDPRDRLVLFKNGRMLTGQVSRNGGGYLIEQPNGRIQVSADEIKFVAADLSDAYRKQRDSIVEPTPATHVALANWCISHRLHDEARAELKTCLKRDPENREARRLLRRLTDTIRADLPEKSKDPTIFRTTDGFLLPDVESLGGLSKENAAQFTSRIQPLLLNKCGNASCHATASPNQFRLGLARTGSTGSRQITERNLAEALRYVDLNDVVNSRLLSATKGSHGGKGTIFVGPAGAEQIRQLRDWVRSVANEKRGDESDFATHSAVTNKDSPKKPFAKVTVASDTAAESIEDGPAADRDPDADDGLMLSVDERARPRELKPDSTDAKALANEPEDAFDPDDFNRRFRRR